MMKKHIIIFILIIGCAFALETPSAVERPMYETANDYESLKWVLVKTYEVFAEYLQHVYNDISAVLWDDLQVQIGNVRLPAAQAASFVEYGAGYAVEFTDGSTEKILFNAQLPHGYKEGEDIRFHVHVAPDDTNGADGNVYWQLTYDWDNVGGTITSGTTVNKATTMDGTGDVHQVEDIATLDGDGKKISSILTCTLARIGGDALDTCDDDVYVIGLDFHYRKDSDGSRREYAK